MLTMHTMQQQTQECLGNLVEKYTKRQDTKNVCITGGYGLNVVANSYLVKRFQIIIFISVLWQMTLAILLVLLLI